VSCVVCGEWTVGVGVRCGVRGVRCGVCGMWCGIRKARGVGCGVRAMCAGYGVAARSVGLCAASGVGEACGARHGERAVLVCGWWCAAGGVWCVLWGVWRGGCGA
jgi:hypothetical protein